MEKTLHRGVPLKEAVKPRLGVSQDPRIGVKKALLVKTRIGVGRVVVAEPSIRAQRNPA